MSEDLEEIVAKTIAVLGPLIKKPKLTAALLKKPPFRFLHDIVSEAFNSHGVPAGLSEDERNSANYQDRDSKVAYLTMVMEKISAATGQPVPAKPLKIVAGQEPENTNVMLQLLAAAIKGESAPSPVAAPAPAKPAKPPAPAKAPAPAPAPEPEPDTLPPRDLPERPTHAERPPNISPLDGMEPPARGDRQNRERQGRQRQPEPEPEPEPAPSRPPPGPSRSSAPPPAPAPAPAPAPEEYEPPQARNSRPDRPRTARPGPPKIQSNVDTAARPQSKLQGRDSEGPTGVIGDGVVDDDSDDDTPIATTADTFASHAGATMTHARGGGSSISPDASDQGVLSRAIMEQQDKINRVANDDMRRHASKADNEQQQQNSSAPKSKTREEIDRLRETIQKMCKATNPLARCMDYVHEDLDNMQKEMEFWKKDRVVMAQRLDEEQRQTEHILDPLHAQLRSLEETIKGHQLKCAHVKANILQHETTIAERLKTSVRR